MTPPTVADVDHYPVHGRWLATLRADREICLKAVYADAGAHQIDAGLKAEKLEWQAAFVTAHTNLRHEEPAILKPRHFDAR